MSAANELLKSRHETLIGSRSGASALWSNQRWWMPVLALAAAVRIVAAHGDLAMDEIWSLRLVQTSVRNLVDVVAIRHDNNHLLNTVVMWGLGTSLHGIWYRIPAVLASIATVWIAGRQSLRQGGTSACVVTSILIGSSYLLILYGTEARGYSYVVCLAYLSWLFLRRTEASGRWIDALAFALCASLGFLAHLTFLYCFAGFGIWTLRKFSDKRSWTLLLAHVPPAATAAYLFLFFVRGMQIGGGPEVSIPEAVASTLSITAGGPLHGPGAVVVASLMCMILAMGYYQLWQQDRATAACFLTIIVLAPLVILLKTRHAYIYPRYFIVPVAFALLLISDCVSRWWQAGRVGQVATIAFVGLYVAGNGWWTAQLFDHGRGDYSQALAWMATQVDRGPQSVSSDHDLRNRVVMEYYTHQLWPQSSPFEYIELTSLPQAGVDWLILHNFEDEPPHSKQVTDLHGNVYRWERTYRYQSLTGWNWWIYRRVERPMDSANRLTASALD